MKNTLIVIIGPTAVGKTNLSINIAKRLNTVVLSSDSRQFYKEMSIGTAKPTLEEMDDVEHHFINSLSIKDEYNAGKFEYDSISLLKKLWKKHSVVVLTGGSGLYIDAVCKGFHEIPKKNEEIRKQLTESFQKNGITFLQNQLKNLDPQYYKLIDVKNPHRLIRGIEVAITSNKSNLDLKKNSLQKRDFRTIKIGLNIERDELYQKINHRVDKMIQEGLLEEAKILFKFKTYQALQTVGYQELFKFLDNEIALPEAIELIKRNSRRYAKRQLTWFKRDNTITWFKPNQISEVFKFITSKLNSN